MNNNVSKEEAIDSIISHLEILPAENLSLVIELAGTKRGSMARDKVLSLNFKHQIAISILEVCYRDFDLETYAEIVKTAIKRLLESNGNSSEDPRMDIEFLTKLIDIRSAALKKTA